MSVLHWRGEFSVGIEVVDHDHQELIGRINLFDVTGGVGTAGGLGGSGRHGREDTPLGCSGKPEAAMRQSPHVSDGRTPLVQPRPKLG